MILRRPLSLRQQLLLLTLIAGLSGILPVCGVIVLYDRASFLSNLRRQALVETDMLAIASTAAVVFQDEANAAQLLAILPKAPRIIHARLLAHAVGLLASYDRPGPLAPPPMLTAAQQAVDGLYAFPDALVVVRHLSGAGEMVGTLIVTTTLEELALRTRHSISLALGIGMLALLVSCGFAWSVMRRITGSLRAVTEVARMVSIDHNYGVRTSLGQAQLPEEVQLLSDAFRAMLERIEHREWELQRSMAGHSALVQTAVDGVITISDTGTVLSFNPAAERLFGYAAQAVIGQNVRMLMPPPYVEEHDGYLARYQVTREPHIIGTGRDVHGLRQDGTIFPFALSVSEVRTGNECFYSGIIHDLTARVDAEEALRRAHDELEQRIVERTAELVAVNKELEAFAATISHDLRAPLRHITGFATILLDHVTMTLPTQVRDYLRIIYDSATRLGILIDDLLAFSRLGRQPLTRTTVDLAALAREVLADLLPPLAGREIVTDLPDLPPCEGDPALLRQVLVNLLGNALKFTSATPVAHVVMGATVSEAETVYWVKDNGAGFNMAYADKLFGVFQRLHGSEFPGTGVGLAICQRIVQRHGGRIWAEAIEGEGATFFFTLGERNNERV